MGKKGKVPYLTEERGQYKYQRRVPGGLQEALGLKKWLLACGTDYAKAVAKVVALTAEHDALISGLRTPEDRRIHAKTRVRKREGERIAREAFEDAEQATKSARQGVSDADEQEVERALAEMNRTTWRHLPGLIEGLERHQKQAASGEMEWRELSAGPSRDEKLALQTRLAPVPDAFAYWGEDDHYQALKALYGQSFGPDAEVPRDLDERDEYEALKIKMERKLARLAPRSDTLESVAERFYRFTEAKPATLRKYREHVKRLTAKVGDVPLEHVTPQMLRDHRDTLMEKLAVSSVRACFTPLIGILNFAVDEGIVEMSPMGGVRLPKEKRSVEQVKWKPFTPDEMSRILTRSKEYWLEPQPGINSARRIAYEMLVRVLAFTAMRPGELMNLTADDVSDTMIRIREGKTKSAFRVIPLHPAISDFPGWVRANGFDEFAAIQTDRVTPIRENFHRLITRQVSPAIIDDRKALYSLRSTFQNAMRRAGAPDDVRRAVLGHKEAGALRHYDDGPEFEMKARWVKGADPTR